MSTKRDNGEDQSQNENLAKHILLILRQNRGRVLIIFFLIYLYNLVRVGSAGGWSFEHGFQWSSPGYQLFPIPINWYEFGFVFIQVFVPMNIADIILYAIFVANGVWLIWGVLAITYLFIPVFVRIRNRIFSLPNRSP